ncbi:MAG: ABC transporter permease [Nocardioides sp.]
MLDRDQSSLAALNLGGLVTLDSGFALAMTLAAVSIFVFGLLLQRRREYVTLRAQGMPAGQIRRLIATEAGLVASAGLVIGAAVGVAMGYYFVAVLRPLFVLDPGYLVPARAVGVPGLLVAGATLTAALLGSRLVNSLPPTELLREE